MITHATTLTGRVALVTGASRGIGRAAALAYARAGANLFVLARDAAKLDSLVHEIRQVGREATAIVADLGDMRSLETVPATIERVSGGRLDVFLANGAILGPQKPVNALTLEEWNHLFQVNVLGNLHLLALLHPMLSAADAGRVIVMSSYAAVMPLPGNGGYAATKAMLESALRVYAAENAQTPLRANIVNPGGVRTDMRAEFRPNEDPATVPAPAELAPLFIELAAPALETTGATFVFPEWRRKALG